MANKIHINGRFLTQTVTGVQRYAREIVTRLVELDGGRFEILLPRSDDLHIPEVLRPRLRYLGHLQGHAWEQLELGAFVESRRGVLYSPTMTNPLLVSKQLVTVHDVFVLEHPEWVGAQFRRWYGWLCPKLIHKSRPILAGSHYTKAQLIRRFLLPEAAIEVISCGVDDQFQVVSASEQQRIKEKYQLPGRFFLSLGSLEPRKNLPRLIEAWQQLPEADRWPLLLAGELGSSKVFGDFDANSLAQSSSGVRLLGYVPDQDLPGLYAQAGVFVYVSLLEGFGLPPLEATMCGAKVLTSNNSGMQEVMQGVATLVDPLNVSSITQGLIESIRGSAPSAAGVLALRQRYSWDQSARALLELLKGSFG